MARVGEPDYVLIGADDPDGMLRHTDECRQRGYPFIADPSQQLAFSDGELIRNLIDGAAFLFSNEYESHMIEQKTGWSADEVLDRVGIQVTTLGKDGVRVQRKGEPTIELPAAKDVTAVEPTGVGDAFRAGFLAALAWGLGLEHAAQVGCVLAAYVVETVGTQEYTFTAEQFLARLEHSYGGDAADEVGRTSSRSADQGRLRADPAHEVARRRRRPPASSPTYSCPRIRHHAGTSVRAATSVATTATSPPIGTSAKRLASSMIGSGQSIPRQSSSRSARIG